MMRRREILPSLLGLGLLGEDSLWSADEAQLAATAAEAAADGVPKFFSPTVFADFAALGDTLIPSYDGRPGATEARAAEFLDFLLSQSPADLQKIYRDGMAAYRLQAKSLDAAFARQDAFADFLQTAKVAFYRATLNSREYAAAMSARSRSAAGLGNFWLPLDAQ